MSKVAVGRHVGDQVFIAVMGATGSGKSTFINLASGSDLRISDGLESCTHSVDVTRAFELDGRQVVLIDTPGFDDTNRSDTEILDAIATYLGTSYKRRERLSGIIYVHRISDFRMGGSSSRNFQLFCNLCGDAALKNGVIVTNMWGEVDRKKGEAREVELTNKFFNPALAKGASIFRHDNTRESTDRILRYIVENHPLPLLLQTELIDEGKTLLETVTGAELNRELIEATQKQEAEIKQLQEEMEEAMRMKDEETRKELEEAKRELQQKVDKMNRDAEHLKSERHRAPSLQPVDASPKTEKTKKGPVLVQPTENNLKSERHRAPSLKPVEASPKTEKTTKRELLLVQPTENNQFQRKMTKQRSAPQVFSLQSRELIEPQLKPKERKQVRACGVTAEDKQQGTSAQMTAQPIFSHDQSWEATALQVKGTEPPTLSVMRARQRPYQSRQEGAERVVEPTQVYVGHVEEDHKKWGVLEQDQESLKRRIEQLEDHRNGSMRKGVEAGINLIKDTGQSIYAEGVKIVKERKKQKSLLWHAEESSDGYFSS